VVLISLCYEWGKMTKSKGKRVPLGCDFPGPRGHKRTNQNLLQACCVQSPPSHQGSAVTILDKENDDVDG
jgi:hypothetical protein